MRKLVVALVSIATLVGLAPAAQAWTDDKWQSPTGNIWCFSPRWGVACGTLNDGFTVGLRWRGGAGYRLADGAVFNFPTPVYTLEYGRNWNWRARGLVCRSATDGMSCRSRWTDHGFFISRDSYNLW